MRLPKTHACLFTAGYYDFVIIVTIEGVSYTDNTSAFDKKRRRLIHKSKMSELSMFSAMLLMQNWFPQSYRMSVVRRNDRCSRRLHHKPTTVARSRQTTRI